MGAADVETKFVSVERVAEYLRLEEESWDGEARAMLGTAWPSQGEVRLEAVTMRYRLHRSLVLKGVDLFIPGKAKLSFCGRTGCGKSSLFSVLNRLYPLASGRVLIDGVDISQLSLQFLRMSIRVVSQEAFLLSGSLRQNLTMGSSEQDDEVLWHCLSAVGLAEKVRALPASLDFRVDSRWQLLCGRAAAPDSGACPRAKHPLQPRGLDTSTHATLRRGHGKHRCPYR